MSSLLSWDDIEDRPSPEVLLDRAKDNLKNLDTTEAEAELKAQEDYIARKQAAEKAGVDQAVQSTAPLFNPGNGQSPKQLVANSDAILKRALANVERMHASMDEDGRVDVSDKFLLNCRADLNQLVPFKYDWSWLLYLDSCSHHWMPAELGMDRDAPILLANKDRALHMAIGRWLMQYKTREALLPEYTLLTCYRLITNPECRQYILRQSFESAMIHHAIDDVEGYFKPYQHLIEGECVTRTLHAADRERYIERAKQINTLLAVLKDDEFKTAGVENTHKFIESLIYLYGYVNWTMQLIPIYQLMSAVQRVGAGDSLVTLCSRLLRDIRSQTMFGQLFIRNALNENPGFNKFNEVNETFEKLIDLEIGFADTLSVTPDDRANVSGLLTYFINDFLNEAGIPSTIKQTPRSKTVDAFISAVLDESTDTNKEASITGTGSGGSLDWN